MLLIMMLTLLIRSPSFGNPIVATDEQLYLVVGDRMLHGALPYVDMWDRKPVGLFAFYAAIRALGGQGIVQYQIVAALCVGATACLIRTMARRASGSLGGWVAALGYVVTLAPLAGGGGQASVLYNLLTATAASMAFRANDTTDSRAVLRLALAAMAAIGVAIQFKYTPVVEGMFLGCYFLARFERLGTARFHIAAAAGLMVLVALLPTIAAVTFFWSSGHLDAFVQANFVSIFERNSFPAETRSGQRRIIAWVAGPMMAIALAAAVRWWRARRSLADGDAVLMIGWSVAAILGFAMLGEVYDFYFITALLPLMTMAAAMVRRTAAGFAIGAVLIAWPAFPYPQGPGATQWNARAIERLVAAIEPHVRTRCLYVEDGPTVLYLLTNACVPTRYLYPDHLTNPTEAPALGVDPVVETARLLATRPGAIVTADVPLIPRVNPRTRALVRAAIARDYRLVARVKADRVLSVWALRTDSGT